MKLLLCYSAPSMGEVSVTVDQHGRFILTMLHIPQKSSVHVRLGFCLDAHVQIPRISRRSWSFGSAWTGNQPCTHLLASPCLGSLV